MIRRLRQWALGVKRDIMVLWLAARDPRVPWYAKALAALVAAYALSPIDLIPDFIPVLGYLDDLLIVPLGVVLTMRLIPATVIADLRSTADQKPSPTSLIGAAIVVLIWLAAATATVRLAWR